MNRKHLPDYLLVVLSAILLSLAYPTTDYGFLAWFAVSGLIWVLQKPQRKHPFVLAYLAGIIFFAGTFYWFKHVTYVGATLIVFYLSVYFGIFGWAVGYFKDRPALFKVFVLPCVWVVLEFIRGHLFTGFDWGSLGHSQYKNLPLIQIADITGVYGVSWIVMMVNVLISEYFSSKDNKNILKRSLIASFFTTMLLLLCVYGYGALQLKNNRYAQEKIRVALIQPNIPQEVKWSADAWPLIMNKLTRLTREAAVAQPDVILWPETSFPGFMGEDDELFGELQTFVREINIPLLFGAILSEDEKYYNAVFLLKGDGTINGIYRKIHLVPFGEFIPLRKIFPFLEGFIPIDDFFRGREYTVFNLSAEKRSQFSAVVCFEDTVARLVRRFIPQGSGWLVNITNDAWFMDTKAPFLHWQSALFRAVENRKSLVRSANTGVSGFIDPWGRASNLVRDQRGKASYVEGVSVENVFINYEQTFYTKFGDIFTFFCFGCILGGTLIKMRARN